MNTTKSQSKFVLCVRPGDAEDFEARKIYEEGRAGRTPPRDRRKRGGLPAPGRTLPRLQAAARDRSGNRIALGRGAPGASSQPVDGNGRRSRSDLDPDSVGIAERDRLLVPRYVGSHAEALQLARDGRRIKAGDSHTEILSAGGRAQHQFRWSHPEACLPRLL